MCYHITGIIPKKVEIEKLNTINNKYNLLFKPIEAIMVDKSIAVSCTKSICDCGTPLLHGEINENNEDDIIGWYFAIKELLTIKKMKYFGLVIQWKEQDKEVNRIKKEVKLNINKMTYLDLCKLEVDILYTFK